MAAKSELADIKVPQNRLANRTLGGENMCNISESERALSFYILLTTACKKR